MLVQQVPVRSSYVTSYLWDADELSMTVLQTNFIQQPLPPGSTTGAGGAHGQSGALDKGQRMSTGLTTFYQFWCAALVLFSSRAL